MLEIDDLTQIWPNEIPEIIYERMAYKEFFILWWNFRSAPCTLHEKCTRINNHRGPCMRFVSSMTPVPKVKKDKNDLGITLRIDAHRVPLECQSTE